MASEVHKLTSLDHGKASSSLKLALILRARLPPQAGQLHRKLQYKLRPLQISRICLSDGAQYKHTKVLVHPWALSPAWYCALGHSVSYCNRLPRPPLEF